MSGYCNNHNLMPYNINKAQEPSLFPVTMNKIKMSISITDCDCHCLKWTYYNLVKDEPWKYTLFSNISVHSTFFFSKLLEVDVLSKYFQCPKSQCIME